MDAMETTTPNGGGEGGEILQSILFSLQKMIDRYNLSLMLLQQLF